MGFEPTPTGRLTAWSVGGFLVAMKGLLYLVLGALLLSGCATVPAGSPVATAPAAHPAQGVWTSTFETPVGPQTYTFEFQVDGTTLTGTAEGSIFGPKVEIQDGMVIGNSLTFTELPDVADIEIAIYYEGTLNGDEISFVREVGDFGVEELVARRVVEGSGN
jgi:hypothetical protein